jgi:Zn-dependent peptidase ImmA (M78 family)/transcriptional regulator with XRE-family HTH domain
MIVVSDAIRQSREALGLDPGTVAEAVGVDAGVLNAYESGAQAVPGDVLWRLSDVLGVPLEDLDSTEALRRYLDVMAVRFRAGPRAVPDRVRLAVARAATAARDYVELEQIAHRPSRYQTLANRFPTRPPLPRRETWKVGRDLAVLVRRSLGLDGPIKGMLDLVEKHLGILVIWQKLPSDFAGYAFCDEIHGPAIVLNVNGRNQNELVRRFTLGHEACHVLFDRSDLAQLSRFDAYEDLFAYADNAGDPAEICANAFAIHLLAPEALCTRAWRGDIRGLMTEFGISFEAARHHLANYGLLPFTERVSGVPTTASDAWKAAESSELWYPAFDEIPIERRHTVAKLAFELWTTNQITTSRLREVLRVALPHHQLTELAALYLDSIPA